MHLVASKDKQRTLFSKRSSLRQAPVCAVLLQCFSKATTNTDTNNSNNTDNNTNISNNNTNTNNNNITITTTYTTTTTTVTVTNIFHKNYIIVIVKMILIDVHVMTVIVVSQFHYLCTTIRQSYSSNLYTSKIPKKLNLT